MSLDIDVFEALQMMFGIYRRLLSTLQRPMASPLVIYSQIIYYNNFYDLRFYFLQRFLYNVATGDVDLKLTVI